MLTQFETHYFQLLGIRKHIKSRGPLINETVFKFSLSVPKMSKHSRDIEWSKVSGALPKSKRLHLEEDEEDGLFHCPVPTCNHDAFATQRGCQKHVKKNHLLLFIKDPSITFREELQTPC